ncbi:uncharacterized protein At4g38062-like [Actinidia eriantha]|uniref:uncharacterized protein At4g38062-like n=1 Tax=Actinidia eriantha TaxID=165200 RepID=UPI002589B6C4|nr:uncharacterized protein At4g38062-like [Actinidia eriantha]
MERVCVELDEAKAEIEKLRAEHKAKVELCESLKRAHNEQHAKIQDANVKIEKQAQELNEKADEVSNTKQMYEELKSSMKEKEAIIKNIGSLNNKLRGNCDEKMRKWEEEKQELLVALDEANSKNMDQEQKLRACKEEVRGLKSLLSELEKKCLEAEKKAKASKELRQRDDMLDKQEEENRKVEDQLKWKKEQFKHLEEAYEKLRNQLQASTKEWEREKSTLFDEISKLQSNLDSQTRISEDLQSHLWMCNQALAHEESRRKYLEVQLSETKTCFDNVFAECQEAKSEIECLTGQRDKDIASLRDVLGTKEMIHKEMKYQLGRLEQENQELRFSVKELQEAQIQEAGNSSSLSKLRNKLKGLEQIHRDCSKNLRAIEAEWTAKFDKMAGDLSDCRSELEGKDRDINELKMKLGDYRSLIMHLELQDEEKSLMLLVLKSVISEVQLKLADEIADMNRRTCEREEEVSLLRKQLEMKSAALAQKNIAEDHEQQLRLQDELERHKEMLKESWESQLHLKEKGLQMEIDLVKVRDALNRANDELAEKFCERNELEFELQIWRSTAERLEANLEENHQLRKQVEGKDRDINELKMKLRGYRSLIMHLELQDEEKSLLLLVLKSVISEAQLKLADEIADMDRRTCEREAEVSLLRKQLEMKHAALVKAQKSIAEDHEQQLRLQNELERHKEMLKESWESQLRLKEKALQMEIDLVKVRDALNRANDELAEKFCERNELEFELQIWRSIAERLKANLEENHQLRKQVEVSLLADVEVEVTLKQENDSLGRAVEEKDRRIDDLERRIVSLDRKFNAREREKEKEKISSDHQREIECLERECVRRELEGAILAHIDAERIYEHERENFHSLVEERNQRIDDIHQLLGSLEEKFKSSTTSFSLQLAEKEAEVNLLHKAWEKIATDEVLKEIEIQEQRLVIEELEDDFRNLEMKLESLQKTFSRSKEESEHERENLHRLVEERNQRIDDIHQLLWSLEEKFKSSTTSFSLQLAEKETGVNLLHKAWEKIAADEVLKEIEIQELRLVIEELEDDSRNLEMKLESLQKNFSRSKEESEHERENLHRLVEERNQRIDDIHQLLWSLEEKFKRSTTSFSLQLAEKETEVNLLHKAWEKIAADEVLKEIEIQEQRLVIEELEDDFRNLEMKLESLQKTFSRSKEESEKMVSDLRTSNTAIDKLESEKRTLVEDVKKLSSDRESLLDFIGNMSERICEFSIEDMQLMGVWERIQRKLKGDDELFEPSKENMNIHPTSTTKRVEATFDERSPLRALNN